MLDLNSLSALTRNNPLVQGLLNDTVASRQEIVQNPKTNERVIINHRRFVPGSLQAKRRPLGK
jgi:hypothetical protein